MDEEEFNFDDVDWVECPECESLYDSDVHFITKPYRPVCPYCGQILHTTERDRDYYLEY